MHTSEDQESLRGQLRDIFGAARTPQEMDDLINGLLTPSEIEEVAFRWRLVKRLLRGQTQRAISEELGVSLGKISRGSRLLKYGPSGFRRLAERLLQAEDAAAGEEAQ